MSKMISIGGAWAVRNLKYLETGTLRWTAGRRRGQFENVKNLYKAAWFSSVRSTTYIKVVWSLCLEHCFLYNHHSFL